MSSTLDKSLRILEALAERPMNIAEVARLFGMHHSTALRLLRTLEHRHFVTRDSGDYRLGPRLVSLGHLAAESVDVRHVARPYLEALSSSSGETVHLAVLVAGEVIYIDKVESQHAVRMYSQIGRTSPLHCTGVGKAILAYRTEADVRTTLTGTGLKRYTDHTITDIDALLADLDRSRLRGYTIDDEEHESGIRCVAAPVHGVDGSVESSISIAVPASRWTMEDLERLAPDLRSACEAVSRELGAESV